MDDQTKALLLAQIANDLDAAYSVHVTREATLEPLYSRWTPRERPYVNVGFEVKITYYVPADLTRESLLTDEGGR